MRFVYAAVVAIARAYQRRHVRGDQPHLTMVSAMPLRPLRCMLRMAGFVRPAPRFPPTVGAIASAGDAIVGYTHSVNRSGLHANGSVVESACFSSVNDTRALAEGTWFEALSFVAALA
jgi:hypothetical protein